MLTQHQDKEGESNELNAFPKITINFVKLIFPCSPISATLLFHCSHSASSTVISVGAVHVHVQESSVQDTIALHFWDSYSLRVNPGSS